MPCPQYYTHLELLNSLINKLSITDSELYFVSIQPKQQIFTKEQGIAYINTLFPNIKATIQLERNDKVTNHSFRYKSYDLLPTLHLHLIVSKKYLNQITDILYYKHNKELKGKKGIHITATPLKYKEGVIKYLTKQFNQDLTPFNYLSFAEVTDNYNKPVMKPQHNIINPVSLLQILVSGITYSEAKQNRYNQLKEALNRGAITELRNHIKATKNLNIIAKKYYITRFLIGTKPKPPPTQNQFKLHPNTLGGAIRGAIK